MKPVRNIYEEIKKYFIKYPAVLSGFVIYGYLLYCIVHYFIKLKSLALNNSFVLDNIIDSFDAFPFMWLLSVVLVKIIDVRTKLHESEQQRLIAERELQVHQTQLKTLHEVTRGIQHQINNPLSIILLSLGSAQKAADGNPKVIRKLDAIGDEINRIIAVLSAFSKETSYNVDSVDTHVGDITSRSIVM